ncbi:MAG: tRNA (N(6)-L-threonylcarbamoyladenosine(37)-C(2))-methylthiotransferase MtaB [Nitrospiraceae bacterium]|nr:tRNA (N(6)-L-threonylcarbamoyladenosine(37)-C(2))-methylthiotransferase MtaB [Nitrospiraceae bacterium]|tara:strand:+ start:5095 stop:6423 length:1329 start_codon:yes stop_codon:yes gene_type:complete
MKQRASLHTVGCRLNQSETAIFFHQLQASGFQLVPFGEPTDLFILNTCSVTHSAEADCRRAIRRTMQHSPNAFIAVTGCYAQTGASSLGMIHGVDLIVGSQHKMTVLDLIPSLKKQNTPEIVRGHPTRDNFIIDGVGYFESTRATLKVQDGCDFMCSFCNIPFARGRERSRTMDDLLREGQALIDRGHKEIIISGVNVGKYESAGYSLLDVIRRLEKLPGIIRIRISSIEPTTIPDALLEHMAHSSILCHYLHVPIQSGDDDILRRMHRRYSVCEYKECIEKAARMIPGACFGTDVMVGFPGEGENEFAHTIDVINALPLSYFHVFSYSERPGTAAGKFEEKVHPHIIKARSKQLRTISKTKRLASYHRYIGECVSVLFEQRDTAGYWTGLTDTYVRVSVRTDEDLANKLRLVHVAGIMGDKAVGELVGKNTKPEKRLVMVS